jgi:hypothetical protein
MHLQKEKSSALFNHFYASPKLYSSFAAQGLQHVTIKIYFVCIIDVIDNLETLLYMSADVRAMSNLPR